MVPNLRFTCVHRALSVAKFVPLASDTSAIRFFSYTQTSYGKKKKSRKGGNKGRKDNNNHNSDDDMPTEKFDSRKLIKDAESEFRECIDMFGKEVTQVKMGRADPTIFNKLEVRLSNNRRANFCQVAQTVMKGNKYLNVTVFDPNDTKNVVSAILGANLNLNPEVDPKNPQLLKVLLPNTTKELREKKIKELKKLSDSFKSSHTNPHSLAYLRGEFMKQAKGAEGSKDIIRRFETDVSKLYKDYAAKLNQEYKNASKSL